MKIAKDSFFYEENGMNIYLRELKKDDAFAMLEWMHDERVNYAFRENMKDRTYEDALEFIERANVQMTKGESYHFAVADDSDEYLGTISLQDCDYTNKQAEYTIALRVKAQGHNIGTIATNLVLDKAFNDLGLQRVYLDVLEDNYRAIKMYERAGFVYEGTQRRALIINGQYRNLRLYSILNEEFLPWKSE